MAINLEDAEEGHHVFYLAYPGASPEYGAIKRRNDSFVFVVFDGKDTKACRPETLNWPPEFCGRDKVCPQGQKYS